MVQFSQYIAVSTFYLVVYFFDNFAVASVIYKVLDTEATPT